MLNNPLTILFTDLELKISDLTFKNKRNLPFIFGWFRVEFDIPDVRTSPLKIFEWLETNDIQEYRYYFNEKNLKMIMSFKNRTDVVLFKLSDGHKAFETD